MVRFCLALDLLTTIKNSFPKEWERLGKPSPWLVNTNLSLSYSLITGNFTKSAPEKLLPKYKVLRIIEISCLTTFFLLAYAVYHE